MSNEASRPSLVADVGGTNTRVALADGPKVREGSIRKYPNAEYVSAGKGLDAVIAQFMADMGGIELHGAAVAVAGPVRDGIGRMTNLSWELNGATLARVTGAERAEVLNDLQAQGYALDDLAPGAVRPVLPGLPTGPHETRLVIGAGTGFNIAPVFQTRGGGRLVPPAEAGHVTLPVRSEAEERLCCFIERVAPEAEGFGSVEEVLSGRGLEYVYRWLSEEAGDGAAKKASEIMSALSAGTDPRAIETGRVYVRMLGNVAGNLALTYLPYGGIYFIGGVVRAMTPYLAEFGFAEAFRDKGRFHDFLGQFPVAVVEDDFAALTGCASFLATLD